MATPIRANLPGDGLGPPRYPQTLRQREEEMLRRRRQIVAEDPEQPVSLPDQQVGLALSGGGIRSATFNLGVLQALAAARLLRTVDFISTVSGGGYIGGFLGRLYTRFLNRPVGAPSAIERRLSAPTCEEVQWLRENGHYLAPAGRGDTLVNNAILLRNFVTLQALFWMFGLSLYGIANAFRFYAFPRLVARIEESSTLLATPRLEDLPFSHLLHGVFPQFSPWTTLLDLLVLAWLLPLAVAFWITSERVSQAYEPWTLGAMLVIAAALLVCGFLDGGTLRPVAAIGLSLLLSFWYVERAWRRVKVDLPAGLLHPSTRPAVRNYLSTWLGSALGAGIAVAGFVVLDTGGFLIYALQRGQLPAAMLTMLGVLGGLYPVLKWSARLLSTLLHTSAPLQRRTVFRILTHPAVLPVLFGVPPLLAISFVSHSLFQEGNTLLIGTAASGVLLVASLLTGRPGALPIVNRTSLQSLYAARLARAYLGASNVFRHAGEDGKDVTTTQAEDDVSVHAYRPDMAGGPLHLINICLNETLAHASQRTIRDRQGENLAIGPAGVSVGPTAHALWEDFGRFGRAQGRLRATAVIETPHPFVPMNRSDPIVPSEGLSLGAWIAISGAAISAGRGRETHLGTSLFFTLANLRTGYWWDTHVEDEARGVVENTVTKGLLGLPRRWMRTQALLFDELTARFSGPWRRFWYLSDGGFFENLGGYELVRRRVPIIICVDASQDQEGSLECLGNLIRKVRSDFAADVRFLNAAEIQTLASAHVPTQIIAELGTLDDLRPANGYCRRHAAIARVYYDGSSQPGSVLLYVKANLTGDENADIIAYQLQDAPFPNDSTSEQFFDEAQWESYRKLGEHIGSRLFPPEAPLWMTQVS